MASELSPFATRAVFGQNLRKLIANYASVAEVSRKLGINRSQLNRYLTGESHPRPDALLQICNFFGMDARILVTPLEKLSIERPSLHSHPEIRNFTMADREVIDEATLPSGLYRTSRHSFLYPGKFVISLLYIYRQDGWTFVKGYEARKTLKDQGLPLDPVNRQFRGYVTRTDDGFSAMISRAGAITCSFNFFTPVVSLNRNFWHGYTARTEAEVIGTKRISRMVMEYLADNSHEIMKTARAAGICEMEDLLPFHQKLLRPDVDFS